MNKVRKDGVVELKTDSCVGHEQTNKFTYIHT